MCHLHKNVTSSTSPQFLSPTVWVDVLVLKGLRGGLVKATPWFRQNILLGATDVHAYLTSVLTLCTTLGAVEIK